MKLRKRNKLLFGVGVNDSDYNVVEHKIIDGKRKIVWTCPFYVKWRDMLYRCYHASMQTKFPTYVGCSVCEEWLTFSSFKAWMIQQDWEGKVLDKDILILGNKIYSPDNCVFVNSKVNLFISERVRNRGQWPIGVSWHNRDSKFRARGGSVVTGKDVCIGYFDTPEEAHKAWLAFKLKQAYILASEQTDERVAKALIDRYENYNKRRAL